MGQHRKDRLARGALDTPDGEATETNPGIMRVAGQRAAAIAACFMVELKAKGEDGHWFSLMGALNSRNTWTNGAMAGI